MPFPFYRPVYGRVKLKRDGKTGSGSLGISRSDEDWYEIELDGDYPVAIQRVVDHVPPQWPDGQPQQIHLDFFVDDIRAEHARVLELGAEFLKASSDLDAPTGFQVYADPAGHPFCLCWGWDTWRQETDAAS
nr:VOC family protein [Nesterenkonia massiliensis]